MKIGGRDRDILRFEGRTGDRTCIERHLLIISFGFGAVT